MIPSGIYTPLRLHFIPEASPLSVKVSIFEALHIIFGSSPLKQFAVAATFLKDLNMNSSFGIVPLNALSLISNVASSNRQIQLSWTCIIDHERNCSVIESKREISL